MENRIVETPNGYKVALRPFITYPKFVEIQKAFTDNVRLNPVDNTQEFEKISASLTFEVEEKLIKYLIVSITDKEGNTVDTKEDYLPLPPVDCMSVKAVIDEISNEATEAFTKKK